MSGTDHSPKRSLLALAVTVVVAVALCGSALAAGDSNNAWVKNTWNEDTNGLLHAYFVLPPRRNTSPRKFFLELSTFGPNNQGFSCKLVVHGQTRAATSYVNFQDSNDFYLASFKWPRFRTSAKATATCAMGLGSGGQV